MANAPLDVLSVKIGVDTSRLKRDLGGVRSEALRQTREMGAAVGREIGARRQLYSVLAQYGVAARFLFGPAAAVYGVVRTYTALQQLNQQIEAAAIELERANFSKAFAIPVEFIDRLRQLGFIFPGVIGQTDAMAKAQKEFNASIAEAPAVMAARGARFATMKETLADPEYRRRVEENAVVGIQWGRRWDEIKKQALRVGAWPLTTPPRILGAALGIETYDRPRKERAAIQDEWDEKVGLYVSGRAKRPVAATVSRGITKKEEAQRAALEAGMIQPKIGMVTGPYIERAVGGAFGGENEGVIDLLGRIADATEAVKDKVAPAGLP